MVWVIFSDSVAVKKAAEPLALLARTVGSEEAGVTRGRCPELALVKREMGDKDPVTRIASMTRDTLSEVLEPSRSVKSLQSAGAP